MQELRERLERTINEDFVGATLSNPRKKEEITKVKIRPIKKKGQFLFQCETFRNNQVFHENLEQDRTISYILEQMEQMKQMQWETKSAVYTALVSKKGKVTIREKRRNTPAKEVCLAHNKQKAYILQEGMDVPFLRDLGVMTQEGKIVRTKFDKFRQINRFLEFVEDILPKLSKEREVTILDFGCGKSYLTFAMYYYLHEMKGYDVRIIGLDLKKDVISHCNALSQKYGYEKLTFLVGDIADYEGVSQVDMVVTLHACDTATDYALAKAVGWDAKVILSVPCCQHELNGQMESEILSPILGYGLIKERMAALVTDALRAEYLCGQGYETQILEFIDMEHTPKNILLRAVKTGKQKANGEALRRCEELFHVEPTLKRLLEQKGETTDEGKNN